MNYSVHHLYTCDFVRKSDNWLINNLITIPWQDRDMILLGKYTFLMFILKMSDVYLNCTESKPNSIDVNAVPWVLLISDKYKKQYQAQIHRE